MTSLYRTLDLILDLQNIVSKNIGVEVAVRFGILRVGVGVGLARSVSRGLEGWFLWGCSKLAAHFEYSPTLERHHFKLIR
jgi:hypothetical protein